MKRFLLLLLSGALFFSCKKENNPVPEPEAPKPAVQKTETITADGRSREYIIFLPTGYNTTTTAMPLVFCLHGGGGTDSGFIKMANFNIIAEREKFVVVYPQGFQNNWNDGRPTTPNQLGVDDVNFFRMMIQQFSTTYKIDAKRIFSTGISNGGFMSSRLGAELGDKTAAIASIAASVEKNTIYNNINGTNRVSAMYIQGIADLLVPFTGGVMTAGSGGTIASHAEVVAKWVIANNCNTTPVVTNIPDIAADGTTAVQREYNGGTNGTSVVSIIIQNGGHTWPQGLQYLPEAIIGKTCMDFNGIETVWAFFKAHPKP
jgi:polyhydroxybutyrate depolymerase